MRFVWLRDGFVGWLDPVIHGLYNFSGLTLKNNKNILNNKTQPKLFTMVPSITTFCIMHVSLLGCLSVRFCLTDCVRVWVCLAVWTPIIVPLSVCQFVECLTAILCPPFNITVELLFGNTVSAHVILPSLFHPPQYVWLSAVISRPFIYETTIVTRYKVTM